MNNGGNDFLHIIQKLLLQEEESPLRLVSTDNILDNLQAFLQNRLKPLHPIQVCILKAILINTSIILDEEAMKQLEMAYNMAPGN